MADEAPARYVSALRFRWLTPAYDLLIRLAFRERTFKSALIVQARLQPGDRVLDVGCGTGTLTIEMAMRCRGAVVTGVDGYPDILQLAARKAAKSNDGIRLDYALASALPYPGRELRSLGFEPLLPSSFVAGKGARRPRGVSRAASRRRAARRRGRATGLLTRGAFIPVQLLDGFDNTRDNVRGRLPALFEGAGFSDVREIRAFATAFGTLALYRARK